MFYFYFVKKEHILGPFLGFFEELSTFLIFTLQFKDQKSLKLLKKPLKIPKYMFFPHKKIMSHIFRISGELIVIKLSYNPLESVFSSLRMLCGSNNISTSVQFKSAFGSLLCNTLNQQILFCWSTQQF